MSSKECPSQLSEEEEGEEGDSCVISLCPNQIADYYAKEVLLHRRVKGPPSEADEYLVKWTRLPPPEKRLLEEEEKARERTRPEYLVWMKRDEVDACRPSLLSVPIIAHHVDRRKDQPGSEGGDVVDSVKGSDALQEMVDDVRSLVSRAQRMVESGVGGKVLLDTCNILDAYAKIGPLASTFREFGSLDLFLQLLCSDDANIRMCTKGILKSLATFDLSGRAYLLLQLTYSGEPGSKYKATLQSRQMLLDLFTTTATMDESELVLKGIRLPHIPGRFVFSVLRKYLQLTSMSQQDESAAPLPPIGPDGERKELTEFELFYLHNQLFSELFTAFGWYEGTIDEFVQRGSDRVFKGLSIFTGTLSQEVVSTKKKRKSPYKTRDDFRSDRDYGQYVKATLKPGMKVKARSHYEQVNEGDYGVFTKMNDSNPPAQFAWEGLGGETYWVWWSMVDILPPVDKNEDYGMMGKPDAVIEAFRQPAIKQPYVMRSLAMPTYDVTKVQKSDELVNRSFWWEVLCVVRSRPPYVTEKTIEVVDDPSVRTFDDLIDLQPTFAQAAKVVEMLEDDHLPVANEMLTIKEMSQFRDSYHDQYAQIAPAKDDGANDNMGAYNKLPPYTDPFDSEPPLRPFYPDDIFDHDEPPVNMYRGLHSFLRHRERRNESDPAHHMRSFEYSQDGSVSRLKTTRDLGEKYLGRFPGSSRLASSTLRALKLGFALMKSEDSRLDACMQGFLSTVLKLMKVEPTSCTLQAVGLESFFKLLGDYAIDPTLPLPPTKTRKYELSEQARSAIVTTMVSLGSAPDHCGLHYLVEAIQLVVTQYYTDMSTSQKSNCVAAIRCGLCVLAVLVGHPETREKMPDWGVSEMLELVVAKFPDFATRSELCQRITTNLPGYVPPPDTKEELTPEQLKALHEEVISVIKVLRRLDEIYNKNPLPRLLAPMEKDVAEEDPIPQTDQTFASVFLAHQGIFYLSIAMQHNRSTAFTENALAIIGAVARVGEEEAAQVVVQGGLRAAVATMVAFPGGRNVQYAGMRLCQILSKDPDNLAVMAAENVIALLKLAKKKYSHDYRFSDQLGEVIDVCESEESGRGQQHQEILGIIFAGILRMLLTAIEDARRNNMFINLPKFAAFMKYISAGSGGTVAVGAREKWWERIETSSNHWHQERLLNENLHEYWESSGRTGSHWIRIFIKKGFIVRKLYLHVDPKDGPRMPQQVVVSGGRHPHDLRDISTVYIPATFSGSFEIVPKSKLFYSCFCIKILSCHQGGVDVRIHGISCQAYRSTLWPLFGDLLLARTKLFHRIQIQNWLEYMELDQLQIFDKLTAVILQEQRFADEFLVTPRARQCIGQACRTALISPLLETLAKRSDIQEGPNLTDLVQDYLDMMNPPVAIQWKALATAASLTPIQVGKVPSYDFAKDRDRLVKMSRIRRMCRLLVDCDDNTASVKSLEEDPDDYIVEERDGTTSQYTVLQTPPGTGTVATATIWKNLVFKEVSKVLQDPGHQSPQGVSANVVGVYNKLKQAMFELFGDHSQFAISLKEGFSKAFLHLDEINGVRFCERLCSCIDSMLDLFGKDAPKFKNIGETQREVMLLKLAEPLQFLHGLDISYVFEHYYRRLLSARLLRGRSTSLPLERRMVHALAHCFPHKHPLQMLNDLEESNQLMERFVDNELLETLDQLMVQASSDDQVSTELVDLSTKCNLYRQRQLRVLILNPCFWPVRHGPLPLSALPFPLSSFCADYVRFFTAIHEYGLQQFERARKISFTLYGWASLLYRNLRISLSTVQMIILLQFNEKESFTLYSLHGATGLPYQDLCDALLCLTAERQKLLNCCAPPTSSPPLQDKDFVYINTSFQLNSEFTINDDFIESKSSGTRVVVRDVQIVSRNTLKGSDHTPDLTKLFDRRRAIIDSAIVRQLKKNKEMSLDNIANKVVKGCSNGHFNHGVLFERFECDFRDVCSRVERLIGDGYIRRDIGHPHVLVYVPDPTELMQPDKTEGGVVQVSRKRVAHGGSLARRKRRMISGQKRDTAPLLSMLPTSKTLTIEEVEVQITELLDSLCQVLNGDPDCIEHLLHCCFWSKDSLIQHYLDQLDSLLKETGLTGDPAVPPPTKGAELTCPICLLSAPASDMLWLWCNHPCCKTCWTSHLAAQVHINRALLCSCPIFGCTARPTRSFFVTACGPDSELVAKFNKAILRSYVDQSGWLTWCRNPQGCNQVLCKGDGVSMGACHKCSWTSCFTCIFLEAHEPASCEDIRKWAEAGGFYVGMDEDAQSKQLASKIAKRCPDCDTQIEKNEGCLHMKCKCGHRFCWKCLRSWRPYHTDFYNCTGTASQAASDHKKFADYNERCTVHEKSRQFAERLTHLIKGIHETIPIKTLSFFNDACDLLVRCYRMLSYAVVAEYYCPPDSTPYLGFLSSALETDTNGLQAFIENTLLMGTDLGKSIRTLPDSTLLSGYRLVSKIESTREKLLVGYHHRFKLGDLPDDLGLRVKVGGHTESDEEESDGEDDVGELVEGGEVVDYVYSDSEEGAGPALPDSYEDEEDFDSLLF